MRGRTRKPYTAHYTGTGDDSSEDEDPARGDDIELEDGVPEDVAVASHPERQGAVQGGTCRSTRGPRSRACPPRTTRRWRRATMEETLALETGLAVLSQKAKAGAKPPKGEK